MQTKMFLPHPIVKLSIVESLCDREVARFESFESCVWRAVSSHHPQEVLLALFSLYVHKRVLKPDTFHFPIVIQTLTDTVQIEITRLLSSLYAV